MEGRRSGGWRDGGGKKDGRTAAGSSRPSENVLHGVTYERRTSTLWIRLVVEGAGGEVVMLQAGFSMVQSLEPPFQVASWGGNLSPRRGHVGSGPRRPAPAKSTSME